MTEPNPRTEALLAWYRTHRRSLPWRKTADPYRILVSEVMLQQTQAERVVPHYLRFLERFPTAARLAAASPAEVLTAWSGLGYNRRALRLRRAAVRITGEGWPRTPEGLRSLPGVGPYTAAAVACFAFGAQVPAIDTNLRRVLARWQGEHADDPELAETAHAEMAGADAAAWNQAVMDLGASLCRPADPACGECPVSSWCTDPTAYRPPRPQGRFQGSRRQARGAVVRALVDSDPLGPESLTERTGIPASRLDRVVADLERDGLVERHRNRFRLPA